jgi:hypothetical protein
LLTRRPGDAGVGLDGLTVDSDRIAAESGMGKWPSRYERRLTDEEGRRLQQIVRRGEHGSIRVRRALIIMAPVPAIARLVAVCFRNTLGDWWHGGPPPDKLNEP